MRPRVIGHPSVPQRPAGTGRALEGRRPAGRWAAEEPCARDRSSYPARSSSESHSASAAASAAWRSPRACVALANLAGAEA